MLFNIFFYLFSSCYKLIVKIICEIVHTFTNMVTVFYRYIYVVVFMCLLDSHVT